MSERDEFDSFQYFIEFTVTVSSSNLNNYFYSEYQQYLYDTIKDLHGKGLGYFVMLMGQTSVSSL